MDARQQYSGTIMESGDGGPPEKKPLCANEEQIAAELEKEMVTIPPLMYLTEDQRKTLICESQLGCILKKGWVIRIGNERDKNACYLIVDGEAHVFDTKKNFLELIQKGTFFGVDGPLFGKRFYSVMAATSMTILKVPRATFEKMLTKDSAFTLSIARNLVVKHNILAELNGFKTFVRQCKMMRQIDREELIARYTKINSSLHPNCNSPDLDIDAWLYSIRRLPANVTSTFIFHISTKAPDMLSHPDISLPIRTSARPRTILKIIEGKCVVILRDLDTDLFDFLSNLCIHIVESGKILEKLNSPLILKDLMDNRKDQARVVSVLGESSLSSEEVAGLERIWPTNLGEHLANILLHYNDFYIKISEPLSHLKQDPVEKWIIRLWIAVAQLFSLGPKTSASNIPDADMVVDLVQVSLSLDIDIGIKKGVPQPGVALHLHPPQGDNGVGGEDEAEGGDEGLPLRGGQAVRLCPLLFHEPHRRHEGKVRPRGSERNHQDRAG